VARYCAIRSPFPDKGFEVMREKKTTASGPQEEGAPVYQLKITLLGLPVWRKLEVRGDMSLGLLHAVIQVAMGWTNSHLHQFIAGKKRYTDMDTLDGGGLDDGMDFDEDEITLMDIAPKAKKKFVYEYDFGDSWEHGILVEKISAEELPLRYVAQCLDGKGACPPEDCGGIGGYADLLEIIHDPKHPEYESMMEWLGDGFDPEAFDIKEVNKSLTKLKGPCVTVNQLAKVLMARDGYTG